MSFFPLLITWWRKERGEVHVQVHDEIKNIHMKNSYWDAEMFMMTAVTRILWKCD